MEKTDASNNTMFSSENDGVKKRLAGNTSQSDYVLFLENELKNLKCELDKSKKECRTLKEILHSKEKAAAERLEGLQKSVDAQRYERKAFQTLLNGLSDFENEESNPTQPQEDSFEVIYSDLTQFQVPTRNTTRARPLSFNESVEDEKDRNFNSETTCHNTQPPPLPKARSADTGQEGTPMTRVSSAPGSLAKVKKMHSVRQKIKHFSLKKVSKGDGDLA